MTLLDRILLASTNAVAIAVGLLLLNGLIIGNPKVIAPALLTLAAAAAVNITTRIGVKA